MNFQEPMWCRWANLVPWIIFWKKRKLEPGGAVGCVLTCFFWRGGPFLAGGFKYLTNIFQMGWNHQPVMVVFWDQSDVFVICFCYFLFVDSMICVFVWGVAEEHVCIVSVPPQTYLWMGFVPRKATIRIHRANIANSWVKLFSRASC